MTDAEQPEDAVNPSNEPLPAFEDQVRFWDEWNVERRENSELSHRVAAQVDKVLTWVKSLGRTDMRLLDVGCGAGMFCSLLMPFGKVTGIDIADRVLERARGRLQNVRFITGDFLQADFREEFDLILTVEVLSHVPDQSAFLRKCWEALKPGGHLIIGTQNKYVYERMAETAPPSPLQIRRWVDGRELRRLLEQDFSVEELTSVRPDGHRGMLRLVNSPKLNGILAQLFTQQRVDAFKERNLYGMTLMALARKTPA